MTKKERADRLLVCRGLAPTRQKAQALIMAGLAFSGGRRVEKPGQLLDPGEETVVRANIPYVGRGGLKLEQALQKWKIPVDGKIAADLGASTGGFTDCLLQHGAEKVYAVDVDIKQLDCHLKENARVRRIEKNARYLKKEDFEEPPEVLTADLSFISILKVLPAVREFLGRGTSWPCSSPSLKSEKVRWEKKESCGTPPFMKKRLAR